MEVEDFSKGTGKPFDEHDVPIQWAHDIGGAEQVEDEEVPGVLPTPRRAMRSLSSTAKTSEAMGEYGTTSGYRNEDWSGQRVLR